jgi:hypothetical protein
VTTDPERIHDRDNSILVAVAGSIPSQTPRAVPLGTVPSSGWLLFCDIRQLSKNPARRTPPDTTRIPSDWPVLRAYLCDSPLTARPPCRSRALDRPAPPVSSTDELTRSRETNPVAPVISIHRRAEHYRKRSACEVNKQ